MKSHKIIQRVLIVLLLIGASLQFVNAQDLKVILSESKLIVFGTSNLHDWDIKAEAMSGRMIPVVEQGILKEIKTLSFVVVAEKLKSDHSGMDKNTFKALKTDKYKTITYNLVKVLKISNTADGNYIAETQGDLTISGVTKRIHQSFVIRMNADKILLSGKQKIDMRQYGVEPPTAVFGTIRTGAEVTVDFKVTYN